MVFIVGFLMGLAGCAFVFVPGIQWRGRTVPRKARLWVGGIFCTFLPAVLVIRGFFRWLDPEETINLQIVYWSVAIISLIAGFVVTVRSTRPDKEARRPVVGGVDPFAVPEMPAAGPSGEMPGTPPTVQGDAPAWLAPPPAAPPPASLRSASPKPGKKPSAPPSNPFDFS